MTKSSSQSFYDRPSNYDKFPVVQVSEKDTCIRGWEDICLTINTEVKSRKSGKKVVVVECYQGVLDEELIYHLTKGVRPDVFIHAADTCLSFGEHQELVEEYLGDHPIFGTMSQLQVRDFMDEKKMARVKRLLEFANGTVLIYGTGASLLTDQIDLLVYADMARWEIQQRMRRNEVDNLGVENKMAGFKEKYKRGYFIDWRACDRLKRSLMEKWDYVLDTNEAGKPKMVTGEEVLAGLKKSAHRPFRVVPFFDPGPWGGQWMKEVCDLDRNTVNFAWCFDCVPEENSLLLGFGDCRVEIPSINLVFYQPEALLGEEVFRRFGAEFPIRFDFLDTMDGGNLSLQVHPLKDYIQKEFGIPYTQDESYYMLDTKEGAFVYLGLNEDVDPDQMIRELEAAQNGGPSFEADRHVKKWPVKKHDHVLIPAGTVHCSGKDSMVLEISATPYIFTFKLWDWDRLDLDGKPRPISIEHGKQVIQWDRTEKWTKKELINRFETIAEGDGWREERTGLHESEFIETRRHWFTQKVDHDTQGNLNVLNLVKGREAIVESPTGAFDPFVVHYAETFIVPAAVGAYTIRPFGESEGRECATIKAFVRK